MFPMIDGPDCAKRARSYCWYPPGGVHGAAYPIVRASKYRIDEGYLCKYEKELLFMCQIESEEAVTVKNIKEIAAVDGMGPLDLSASMGCWWDPGNDKVKEPIRVAEKAVLGCGDAYLAGFSMPHDAPDGMRRRGYHMICGAVAVGLFSSAAVEDVKKFRMSKIVHDHNK